MRSNKIVYNEECADRQFFQKNHFGEICWLCVNHRLKALSSVVHVGGKGYYISDVVCDNGNKNQRKIN